MFKRTSESMSRTININFGLVKKRGEIKSVTETQSLRQPKLSESQPRVKKGGTDARNPKSRDGRWCGRARGRNRRKKESMEKEIRKKWEFVIKKLNIYYIYVKIIL